MATNMNRRPALSLVDPPGASFDPDAERELEVGPDGQPVERFTTWQKVGIGVGVTAGVGLAGYGVFRLGKWAGWWGRSSSIVIDESEREPSKGEDAKPSGGGGGGGTDSVPDSGGKTRAIGKPPNMSGDPQGYNTKVWPSPSPVRLAFKAHGYDMPYSQDAITNASKPHDEVVRRFQRDWNKVINGIDAGKVGLPSDPKDALALRSLRGLLDDDGVPGKNTLNALEIASANLGKNGLRWPDLVKEAG